jgi:hypothetical protein
MGVHLIGRVLDQWSAVSTPGYPVWGLPAPSGAEETQHYYLRVAVLDPRTERVHEWKVECTDVGQWARYPVGSWVRLRVHRWPPFCPVVRFVTIVDPVREDP